VNKRFLRHILFWLAYCMQSTLHEYTWVHDYYATQTDTFWLALRFNLCLVPILILFTYLVMYVFMERVLTARKLYIVIPQVVLALFIAIFLQCVVNNYIVMAKLYPARPVTFAHAFNLDTGLMALLDTGYVTGVALALKLFRMQIIELRNKRDLVKDKLETELKFLKNQINPHFLFNTLNNIYGLARKKSDCAPEMVLKLSKLLRFILYESGRDTIPIADEIRIIDDYVELEKLRYNNRLKLTFDRQIDDMGQLIAPMLLLTFVENAFKHGVSETTENTCICIKIVLQKGQLTFFINNSQEYNGVNEVQEKIGLRNVRRQLELMYREFNLGIDNLADNFNVNLHINLNSYATI
jgi:two-component system, LytTR family, sensor kinase